MPESIDALLDGGLADLGESLLVAETLRSEASRVDGRIIGTGEADFTKGNTAYVLRHCGATFQLLDVPGIEGQEALYLPAVRQAIARSHLVFYVSASTKKPEKTTAMKIQLHLRRGTQVVALVNVRGLADSYEFAEDRLTLIGEGTQKILEQTLDVLSSALSPGVLLSGHCVHGLLAFMSLARIRGSGETSIHPSRDADLVPQQRRYLECFRSPEVMCDFSRLSDVADLLRTRAATFREDIVESHKSKVRSLLAEQHAVLRNLLENHRVVAARALIGFEAARKAIDEALDEFERFSERDAGIHCDHLLKTVSNEAGDAVEMHVDDVAKLQEIVEDSLSGAAKCLEFRIRTALTDHVRDLVENIRIAMERLAKDLVRYEHEQAVALGDAQEFVFEPIELDARLDKDFLQSLGVGLFGYVTLGLELGSAFGPWGAAIGAAIGAVLAIVFAGIRYMGSRESFVRRTQAKVQARIDAEIAKFRCQLLPKVAAAAGKVRTECHARAHARVGEIQAGVERPLVIMERQIAALTTMTHQLEQMPRGTIRPFQH